MELKKRRLSKGWSQEQLAEISGLSVRTIQRLEKGEKPGLETLNALAAGFEISSSELQELDKLQNLDNSFQRNDAENLTVAVFFPVKWKGFIIHLVTSMVVITWLLGMNYAFELESELVKWVSYSLGLVLVAHGVHLLRGADDTDPPKSS